MTPYYDITYSYAVGDKFIYGNEECEAVKVIPSGEQLVLFDPKTEEGNYIVCH